MCWHFYQSEMSNLITNMLNLLYYFTFMERVSATGKSTGQRVLCCHMTS